MIDWHNPKDAEETIERARLVLEGRLKSGSLVYEEVARLLSGDFHYYVEFTRTSVKHKTSAKGHAVISGVNDFSEAMKMAEENYPLNLIKKVTPEWAVEDWSRFDQELDKHAKESVTLNQ